MARSQNGILRVWGSRAAKLAAAASLGLVLSCAGMAVTSAYAAPSATEIAMAAQTTQGAQVAVDETAIVGEWSLKSMLLPGASDPITFPAEGVELEVTLQVKDSGEVELLANNAGNSQLIEGTWLAADNGFEFDFGANGFYSVVLDEDGLLTCTSTEETLVFEKTGAAEAVEVIETTDNGQIEDPIVDPIADPEPTTEPDAVIEEDPYVGEWQLTDINIEGLETGIGDAILDFLTNVIGISGDVYIDDYGYYYLTVSSPWGYLFNYYGEWETSGTTGIRFSDEDGNMLYTLRGNLEYGQMVLRYRTPTLGIVFDFVFDKLSYDYDSEYFAIAMFEYNEGTGYSWTCQIEDESVVYLEYEESFTNEDADGKVGAGATAFYMFDPQDEGTTQITFTFARPWEQTADDITCIYTVEVSEDGVMTVVDYEGPEEYAANFEIFGGAEFDAYYDL
ncbi:MAG: protease inhibitor I42 family protein [Coriobacteriales bacterium]|nr:protease inhibitor I42 family protein [Coriobacteriales bacterium]